MSWISNERLWLAYKTFSQESLKETLQSIRTIVAFASQTCRVNHFFEREEGQGCAASFPARRCRPTRAIEIAIPTRKPRSVKCSLPGCWRKAMEQTISLVQAACEATNREATFAIIVRGREKIFEPSPFPPHKVTTPSQRTVDRTVKYAIYDRSSRGSSLPTSVGLRNSSSSTCIVPYGGHQQWTHQRSFSNVHSTLVFLPVKSSIYVNADRISRISINPPLPHSFFFDPTHNSLFNLSDSYLVPFSS